MVKLEIDMTVSNQTVHRCVIGSGITTQGIIFELRISKENKLKNEIIPNQSYVLLEVSTSQIMFRTKGDYR